jgi:threonine/homoserine/homoserine lactone efflux protein
LPADNRWPDHRGQPYIDAVVPAGQLLAFAALAAVLIAIPGPSVLFTISRALTVGRRAALFTVAGNELGLGVQVAAVAFGVGAVIARSAEIFTIVKWAGAAYLAYLGVQAIRHRRSIADALAAQITPVRPLRAVRDGFLVGMTNPKSIVFFVVVLPDFTSRAAGHLPVQAQMLAVGALFPLIALLLDSMWAAAAGTVRQWFTRSPRRLAMIGGAGGLAMIGLGVGLAVTGRKDLCVLHPCRPVQRGSNPSAMAAALFLCFCAPGLASMAGTPQQSATARS